MEEFDVLCVGDALIDAFLTIHQSSEQLAVDHEKNLLCVGFGKKIPVDACEFLLGGDACNVSVGLSRLGLKTALAAEIGDDEFSQKIINGVKKEGVDDGRILLGQRTPSSFSIGINFQGERTLFVDHVIRRHDFSFEGVKTKWVYLTSIGEEWEVAYGKTLDFCEKTGAKLAFSPGTHQLMKGPYYVMKVVTKADAVFVNKEEAARILTAPPVEVKDLLINLQNAGPSIVSITDGQNGSYAIDPSKKKYKLGITSGEPIERTGAGDAYASGFLAAVIKGQTVSEAMRWGSVNSASVIGVVGAQPGLLNLERMQRHLDVLHIFQPSAYD